MPDQSCIRRDFFERVYQENLWGSSESRSGAGSERSVAAPLVMQLPSIFEAHGVRSIVDAPCGDFNWMGDVVAQTGVDYLGIDIVESLIARNSQCYGSDRVHFRCADIITDRPYPGDLVFVRDLMIHLSLDLCAQILHNLAQSPIRFVMLTHDLAIERYTAEENIDLDDGKIASLRDGVSYLYRPICMTLPPFNLPAPLLSVREADGVWNGYKSMSLWSREQLVVAGYGVTCSPEM